MIRLSEIIGAGSAQEAAQDQQIDANEQQAAVNESAIAALQSRLDDVDSIDSMQQRFQTMRDI